MFRTVKQESGETPAEWALYVILLLLLDLRSLSVLRYIRYPGRVAKEYRQADEATEELYGREFDAGNRSEF